MNSLKQCGRDVLDRTAALFREGRVRYMGTFYSEPLGMCMDGMTTLESALLGTEITRRELGSPEGFFLQEIAYFPQAPWVMNRLGVQWTILRDWDGDIFFPYVLVGLDGSRCIGVPTIGSSDLDAIAPNDVPDNALFLLHNDLEIPGTIKKTDLFRERMEQAGIHTEWTFVADYLAEHGAKGEKCPGPSTNKDEDPACSPSYSRWIAKPIDIVSHEITLTAMERYRLASTLSITAVKNEHCVPRLKTHPRSYLTWDVESLNDYPGVEDTYLSGNNGIPPLDRIRHLLAWSTNSDARGWYPMLERTIERREGFAEAQMIAESCIRAMLENDVSSSSAGYWALNNFPFGAGLERFVADEPTDLKSTDETVSVASIRPVPGGFEHFVRINLPAYSVAAAALTRPDSTLLSERQHGSRVTAGGVTVEHVGSGTDVRITAGDRSAKLSIVPFKVYVERYDAALRSTRSEGAPRVSIINDELPTLIVDYQLDWHVHLSTEYVIDRGNVYATWRFYFTAPTLIDAEPSKELCEMDFKPGGLRARLVTGYAGDVFFDSLFGESKHPTREQSYFTALTHAYMQNQTGGFLLASRTGSQSFHSVPDTGDFGVCFGKSNTSGGRRKLSFHVGDDVLDVEAEQEWYKEPFFGEYTHTFVIRPFDGDAASAQIPVWGRALALGSRLMSSIGVVPDALHTLYELEPVNVVLSGVNHQDRTLVFNEVCGTPCSFTFRCGDVTHRGEIGAYGINEHTLRRL
jgi:hypothetical protein